MICTSDNLQLVFLLLLVFQVKHFLADFVFQTSYHFKKFREDWGFFLPLLSHAAVHGLMTFLIVMAVKPQLWWLYGVDVVVHFIVDRIKAGPKYLGRFKVMSGKEIFQAQWVLSEAKSYKENPDRYAEGSDALIKSYEKQEQEKLRGNRYFWLSLAADQMAHHLTHYFIIWMLVV